MRKLLLLFIVGLSIIVGLRIFVDGDQGNISSLPIFTPSETTSPTPKAGHLFEYNDTAYRVQYFQANPTNISLFSNFTEKLSAKELMMQKECKSLINGGFYSQENTPLGLLISDGYTQSDYRTNSLFNGIFGVTYADEAFLGASYPMGSTRVAIQSGPLLIKDSKVQTLQLKNDEYARRSVAAISDDKVYFFSVYLNGSEYDGPLLKDLPSVINEFAKAQDIVLTDAINLDGGSASAFYTEGVSLQELSYIGSYFCIN